MCYLNNYLDYQFGTCVRPPLYLSPSEKHSNTPSTNDCRTSCDSNRLKIMIYARDTSSSTTYLPHYNRVRSLLLLGDLPHHSKLFRLKPTASNFLQRRLLDAVQSTQGNYHVLLDAVALRSEFKQTYWATSDSEPVPPSAVVWNSSSCVRWATTFCKENRRVYKNSAVKKIQNQSGRTQQFIWKVWHSVKK